jgi:hypothetical protein
MLSFPFKAPNPGQNLKSPLCKKKGPLPFFLQRGALKKTKGGFGGIRAPAFFYAFGIKKGGKGRFKRPPGPFAFAFFSML